MYEEVLFSRDKTRLDFAVFCLWAVAEKHGIRSGDVFRTLNAIGGLEFIFECYEIMHSQGKLWVISELENYAMLRGAQFGSD